jgi:16S rRNA (uracil1498-N3)-methyltransferase
MHRSLRRFFIDPAAIKESTALLTGPEVHHLKNVLRLKSGDRIELFDGTGKTYLTVIAYFTKDTIEMRILSVEETAANTPQLIIGQALLTGKKMDLIVQKATELGINTLQPFLAEHCARPDINAAKGQRWDRIILEACKQCGRPQPMTCPPPIDFDELLLLHAESLVKLLLWEQEQNQTMQKIFSSLPVDRELMTGPTFALIGPEGGFSASEISRAVAAGFQPVTLGHRILRAETAAIAVMSILQFLLGNLNREA